MVLLQRLVRLFDDESVVTLQIADGGDGAAAVDAIDVTEERALQSVRIAKAVGRDGRAPLGASGAPRRE